MSYCLKGVTDMQMVSSLFSLIVMLFQLLIRLLCA